MFNQNVLLFFWVNKNVRKSTRIINHLTCFPFEHSLFSIFISRFFLSFHFFIPFHHHHHRHQQPIFIENCRKQRRLVFRKLCSTNCFCFKFYPKQNNILLLLQMHYMLSLHLQWVCSFSFVIYICHTHYTFNVFSSNHNILFQLTIFFSFFC